MNKNVFRLIVVATVLLFCFNGTVLDLLGWTYSLDQGSFATKIHPATYVAVVAAIVAAVSDPWRVLFVVRQPRFLLFAVATLILLVRAVMIARTGVTGGEISAVLTNFLTPLLLLICLQIVASPDLQRLALPLRVFFVINSLMALAERVVGHRFIPGFLDHTHDDRSAALVAHPLNGSLLTGLMIVYLVTARRGQTPILARIPELVLHAAAMFAFGGRSALVFTPTILVLSAVLGRNRANEARLSLLQRALPLMVVFIGTILIFLPLPFVDATLDRFTNDSNSSETRNSAVQMFMALPRNDLMVGLNLNERVMYGNAYHTPAGFELAWIQLAVTFGLVAILPMLVALPLMLIRTAQRLDRSAFYMAVLFLVVTAGSLAFGVKSLVVAQTFVLIFALAQPQLLAPRLNNPAAPRPRSAVRFATLGDSRPEEREQGRRRRR